MRVERWVGGSLIGLLALGAPASGCVLPAPTTWALVRDADLIAVVKVDAFDRDRKQTRCESAALSAQTECDVAVLRILETWKGSLRREVRVSFDGALVAGERKVAVGDQLLVFLEMGDTQVRRALGVSPEPVSPLDFETPLADSFTGLVDDETGSDLSEVSDVRPESPELTVSAEDLEAAQEEERLWLENRIGHWYFSDQAYGVRALKDEGIPALREFVAGALRLQDSAQVSKERVREWLIQGASVGSTRLYAIEDLGKLLNAYADPSEGEIREAPLLEDELQTLARGFLRDSASDESVPLLMNLLAGVPDPALDGAFADAIAAAISSSPIPSWTPDAIRYLVARRGWRDWGAEVWHRDLEAGNLRQRWPLLLKDLRLEGFHGRPDGGAQQEGDRKSQ